MHKLLRVGVLLGWILSAPVVALAAQENHEAPQENKAPQENAAQEGQSAGAATAPAIPSSKAAQGLLLDVVRAGNRLIAVGERGHVVLSDDEGTHWRQAAVPTRALLTAAWFTDAQRGWAVGHDSTVLHTLDGGETWVVQHQAYFDSAAVEAELDAQMADEDEVDDSYEAPRVVSQAQRTGVALMDIWFDVSGRHGLAVGAYGLLLETMDGGANWRDQSSRLANPEGWHLSSIAANASGKLLIVGEKGIAFSSSDSGRSFSRIKTPAESSLFGVAADGNAFWAVGLQGRLLRVDGGWRAQPTGTSYVLNKAMLKTDGSLIAVGNGGIVVTVPRRGKPVVLQRADRRAISAVIVVGDGLVLVGEGGAVRARADGSMY